MTWLLSASQASFQLNSQGCLTSMSVQTKFHLKPRLCFTLSTMLCWSYHLLRKDDSRETPSSLSNGRFLLEKSHGIHLMKHNMQWRCSYTWTSALSLYLDTEAIQSSQSGVWSISLQKCVFILFQNCSVREAVFLKYILGTQLS